ncbi:hypothetical protein AJ80_04881 [Polytolypa hystricis UAMH7299]|uniref:Non-reducing polyketide synthase nscA n=1 Tax=Polytolypa hystricis (strain UAMH7299) TaxID=1447883 RepID=A0A2B7Y814_POLH7|nr:hypothetical protein AJ80_04881 [Polytolypa hystricis UAMH7299]
MPQRNEPIAIVGSACHFPGDCNSPSKLWELLKEPRDLLQTVPSKRFNAEAWYHPDNAHHGTGNVTKSYFLTEDPATFDAQFFSIPPNECEAIDPQQRMLLETVYESLSAAGLTMESLRGSPTACYVGQMCDDWSGMMMKDWDSIPQYAATGISRSIMSNRISYFFDWHGPSMTIDTACSSSLVAVHEAVQVLRSGDSKVAVACGANLILSPGMYIAESKLKMLSPEGRSRMWDEDANGYARGEGIAAVVLKTLSQAIKDGDHIDCIIRETGLNQDGRTTGITMPSNVAQTALIRDTYTKAGLDPLNPNDRPQFFHAHGTGTPAGDPQEAEAISRAFFKEDEKSDAKLYVGSIKTVIGHTEGTAGLASLIGTVLAIQNEAVPPNMHFKRLADKVAPFYTNLEVPTSRKVWPSPAPGQPLRASVNSFGFGGANAHAILESYEPTSKYEPRSDVPLFTPLTFSANSEKSLRETLASFSQYLSAGDAKSIRDIAWTLQSRRSALNIKASISGRNPTDLVASIDKALEKKDNIGVRSSGSNKPKILGVFTGQGAQWPTMGNQLIKTSPRVRGIVDMLDRSLQDLPEADRPSWSIASELEASKEKSRLAEAALSQPLCTAVQIVLVDLIKATGVEFEAVVGHSSGEIAAAYAAGIISAWDAIRIAYYRGVYAKLAGSSSGMKGAMMAVGTSLEDAEEFCELEQFEGRLTVAASNAAASVTLSGDDDAIDEAQAIFKDESKFCRKLRVDTAYHSFHMVPCSEHYLKALKRCNIKLGDESSTTWFSSVVPETKMSKENLTNQYWADNMNNTVLFHQAVITAVQAAVPDLVIEVGPHPALKGPCSENIEQASGKAGTPYTGLLERGTDDVNAFSAALGYIWERFGSSSVDFDGYDRIASGITEHKSVAADLPSYPWDHDRTYWAESRTSAGYNKREAGPHPVLGVRVVEGTTGPQIQWRNILYLREISWIAGHKIQNQNVYPASAYVCMAVEAIQTVAQGKSVQLIELTDFTIGRAISFFDESAGIETLFTLSITTSSSDLISASFQISSCPKGERTMSLNASGTISVTLGKPSESALSATPVTQFNMREVEVDRFYTTLATTGYNYSHPFKGITSIRRRTDTAVGEITEARGTAWEDNLLVHPGFVDTSFQTVFAAYCSPGDERLWSIHVPTNIKRLSINPALAVFPPGKEIARPWQAVLTSDTHSTPKADVEVFAENGKDVLMEIEGIVLVPLSKATEDNDSQLFSNFVYQLAEPDGEIAGPNRPTDLDVAIAKASERFTYYWVRKVLEAVTPEEEAQTLTHYKHMLNWCRFVNGQVLNGEHPYVGAEARNDTLEYAESLVAPFGARRDIGLIRAVGENLADVIRTRGNIVEYMVKDGMLDAFYEEGLGLHIANGWEANMAAQLVHRYPNMKIIEIGGGTGGSTRMILPKLGKAFTSYTFTDISAGFFEAAEERFKEYSDRMIFKTFDMEKDITEQGYVEGSYDMILASNVLHAGPDLDLIMSNVRRLVKPGGWLVNMEAATYFPSLRNGFSMAGLPGWWCGADRGRPWGPTISVEEWDRLYRRTGWSGVDTWVPHMDALHHFTVMATQAIDDRVKLLREPLAPESTDTRHETLAIVGGRTDKVARIVDDLMDMLSPRFDSVINVKSIDDFADGTAQVPTTVLNLAELDAPIMKELMEGQPQKLDALKEIYSNARDIVWVTLGGRSENPHARMLVGMARALRKEYPSINLQALDIDRIDSDSASLFAKTLLRYKKINEWDTQLIPGSFLWSQEPELHLQDGRIYIPRLRPCEDMNDRYNSAKRQVTHTALTGSSGIELVGQNGSYELQEPSPLKALRGTSAEDTVIRVSKSLLQSVAVPAAGHFSLSYGTNEAGEFLLALSSSIESVINAPQEWTIPFISKADPAQVLLSVAANLFASVVLAEAGSNSTILVHNPDPIVAAVLSKQAATRRIRVFFTTTRAEKRGGAHWIYIHPRTPRRLLKKQLPRDLSLFIKLSDEKDNQVVHDILESLPYGCKVSDQSTYFASNPAPLPGVSHAQVSKYFSQAWSLAKAANFVVSCSRDTIPLADVTGFSAQTEQLAIVDWENSGEVPVAVQPIDGSNNLFSSDKTYFMAGLSGELGQTLTQWMVKHGARYVVLTSRRPRVNEEWIESLEEEYGATVKAMALDITDRDAIHACYNKISRTMPPIAGVGHGAMVLVDGLFQNMSYDDLMTVLRPKILGAMYLDELFSEDTLDFFVLFSSITGVIGNTGQSNYIGANFFMESLALQRRNRGLAASVMAISSLVGIGYVERSENFDADYFSRLGYRNISEQDLNLLFAEAVVRGRPGAVGSHEIVTGVVPRYEDDEIRASYLQDIKFSHLILKRTSAKQDGGSSVQVPVRVQLQSVTSEDEAREIMQIGFTSRIKKILRIPEEDEFSTTVSLVEQGVDSLVAVEVRAWFSKEVDVDIPVLKVLGGASITELLNEAVQRLSPAVAPLLGSGAADGAKPSAGKPVAPPATSQPAPVMNGHPKEPKPEPKKLTNGITNGENTSAIGQPAIVAEKPKTNGVINGIANGDQGAKSPDTQISLETLSKSEVTERMSFGQSRFWFLNQALKDKTTFNMAILVRLDGRVRVDDMERAVQTVVLRHEALRTRYFTTGEYMENPMQGVIPTATMKLSHKQINGESDAYKELDVIKSHIWDLERWETLKVSLLSASETKHYLVIGCHHIVMDGFSFNIFYEELEKAYKGQRLSPLPEPSQYRAFARQQREEWESGKMNEDLEYYRNIIPKDPKPLPLFPFSRTSTRVPLETYGAHRVDIHIDASLTSKIKAVSRKLKSTTFHFYLTALQVLVFRLLNDCDEFFVGVADANRTDNKYMNTLGFFLNLLPLRLQRHSAKSFGEAVQQIRNKVYTGLAHSKLPFDILLEELDIPRSATYTPLFQVFVDYRQGVEEKQRYMGLDAVGEHWHVAKTGYDMTLDILENASGDSRIELRLQESLYTLESTKLLLDGYVNLLTALVNNPDVDLNTPEVWRGETINKALDAGRGAAIEYEWGPTVVHRIDDMIREHGSDLALKDGTGRVLNYSQMAGRVNAICAALVEANAVDGAKVAVFQQPTTDWICSMLAIFRAGAVYLPLDLRTPLPRLATIVGVAQPQVILAHDQTRSDVEALGAPNAKAINISTLPASGQPIPNLAKAGASAVVLFTSGSTGVPKGIHNNHTNIIRQLEGFSKQCNLQASASYVLQQGAYSFDKSLEQIFTGLVHGGALYIVPAEQRGDPSSIAQIMASEGITHTATTPSEYLMWFRYAKETLAQATSWKCCVLGGEVAPEALFEEFRNFGVPVRLLNSYGPAEITMACAKGDLPYQSMTPGEPAPAGLILPNYSVYIVDENLCPLPLGFNGEIVVGGVGVSQGYLENEVLTKEKFIPNSFGGSGTVYRTGDKGRLNEAGELFCDGRLDGDTQIKLRGVRMELEDIENSIIQAGNGILIGAVVTLRGEQESAFLAAHVVFAPSYTENRDTFISRLPLILQLPQYMIPAVFIALDSLPLTTHFKIDRKAIEQLAIPEQASVNNVESGELSETESQLASLWQQIIPRAPPLNPSTNFFHVGGNSLMLVKLQALIRETFSINVRLIDVMNSGTLGNMARTIDHALEVKLVDWDAETKLPELPTQAQDTFVSLKPTRQTDLAVMLTGASGVLGRNMLANLVSDQRISKIYAVAVRAQGNSMFETINDPEGKVIIKEGDLDQPLLGLSKKEAETLSNEVDAILHFGANRSFWDSYYQLRSTNVSSVKEIIRIADWRKIPIHFVSSGGVSSYSSSAPPVDGSDGYVASKWAAEKLLANAAEQLGLKIVVHRPVKEHGISLAPPEMLDELLTLARKIRKRPMLDGLGGTLGIVPVENIVHNISAALFDATLLQTGEPKIVPHSSALNVDVRAFAEKMIEDEEVLKMEGMPALKWMGVAKKMGWSQFMVGQEILMGNGADQIVSRR